MCLFPNNEVTPEYYSPIDGAGRRIDRDQRLELSRGTVEFVVLKEYWVKEPVLLRWLFIIETSRDAVERKWVEVVSKAIKESLYEGVEDEAEPAEGEEKEVKGR